jgi:tetratricopeptide (TPR) repeat protein
MDLPAAIADFGKALSIDSSSDLVFLHRGIARYQLGEYQAALGDLRKSSELNPNDANAWLYAGYCYEGLNDFKAALDDLDKGIKLDPTPDGYENKALIEIVLGNFKDALGVSEKAIALDSTRVRAHNLRGQARFGLEDDKGALDDFNFVLNADPHDAQVLHNRAIVKSNLEDKAGGCADYQLSLKYGGKPDPEMAEYCK